MFNVVNERSRSELRFFKYCMYDFTFSILYVYLTSELLQENQSHSDDHRGKDQTRKHEMNTDPIPKNKLCQFLKTLSYTDLYNSWLSF